MVNGESVVRNTFNDQAAVWSGLQHVHWLPSQVDKQGQRSLAEYMRSQWSNH